MIGTCLCLHTLSDWFAQSAFILKVFQSTWKYLFQKYLFCIFQQGDFDKASSILHIALRMAQDMNHLDGVTYIYNLLADMAFERVSSLNVWWQYGAICFIWSCRVTLKPIFFHYFQGDYMQAERLYKSVIQRQVSKGTGTPLFSWSISNLFYFT